MRYGPDDLDSYGIPYHPAGLRKLTDEQLDEAISASSHSLTGRDLLQEQYRRDAARRELNMVRMTKAITILTAIVALATVVLLLRPGP